MQSTEMQNNSDNSHRNAVYDFNIHETAWVLVMWVEWDALASAFLLQFGEQFNTHLPNAKIFSLCHIALKSRAAAAATVAVVVFVVVAVVVMNMFHVFILVSALMEIWT